MGQKDDFLTALNTLPAGIEELRANQIPVLADVEPPADQEEALIAIANVEINFNKVMQTLVGLRPVELLLHIGQCNETLQGMLLASLQYLGNIVHDFMIISPQTAPGAYYNKDDLVQFTAEGTKNPKTLGGMDVMIIETGQLFRLDRIEIGSFMKNIVVEVPPESSFPLELTARFSPNYTDTDYLNSKSVVFTLTSEAPPPPPPG